jgi:glycyl-tRNA synthetase beta chain
VKLGELVDQALEGLGPWTKRPAAEVRAEVLEFFRLRLKNLLTGRGASADGAEAVLSLHFEDLVPAAARVQALEEIKARPDFSDLAAAFKRVVNIIRKFGAHDDFHPERLELDQEQTLFQAVKALEDQADRHLAADDFSGLLAGIVALKPRVDRFFDDVLVDDPDPGKKALRLGLLTRVARLFDRVADFSKIST